MNQQKIEVQKQDQEKLTSKEVINHYEKLKNSGEKGTFEKATEKITKWSKEVYDGVNKDIKEKNWGKLLLKGAVGLGGLFLAKKATELVTSTTKSILGILGFGNEKAGEGKEKTEGSLLGILTKIGLGGSAATLIYEAFKGKLGLSDYIGKSPSEIAIMLIGKIKDGGIEMTDDLKNALYSIPGAKMILDFFFKKEKLPARTDRNNNPAAIIYEGFAENLKDLGFKEGEDFEEGDEFTDEFGKKYHTIKFKTKEIGIKATIKLIDKVGFYNDSLGQNRWKYTDKMGMNNENWEKLDENGKLEFLKKMYKHEGGNGKFFDGISVVDGEIEKKKTHTEQIKEKLSDNFIFFNDVRKWVNEKFPENMKGFDIEKIYKESDGLMDFATNLIEKLGITAISTIGSSYVAGLAVGGKMVFYDTPGNIFSILSSAIQLNFQDAEEKIIDGAPTLLIGGGILSTLPLGWKLSKFTGKTLSFPFNVDKQKKLILDLEGIYQQKNRTFKLFSDKAGEEYLNYLGKKYFILKQLGKGNPEKIKNKIIQIVRNDEELRKKLNLEKASNKDIFNKFERVGDEWYNNNWKNKLINKIHSIPKKIIKKGAEKFQKTKEITPEQKETLKKFKNDEINKNLKNLEIKKFLKLNPEKIPPKEISKILIEKSKNFLEEEKNSEKQILDKIKEIKEFAKENKLSLEAPEIKEKLSILNQKIDKITENKGKLFQKFNELFKKLPEDLKTPELVKSIKTFENGTILTRIKKGAIGRVKIMAIMGAIMVGVDTISNIDKISSGEKELSDILKNLSPEMIQMMIDILPFVGTGSMLYGAATGEETYTENKLDTTGRVENFLFGMGGLVMDAVTITGIGSSVGIMGKIGLVIGKYGLKGEKAKFFYESLKETVGKISKLADKTSWSEVAGNFKKIISTKKTQAVKVANYTTYGGTALAIGNGGFQYFYGNSEVVDAKNIDPKLQ